MNNELISRRDIKDHIGELLLVYSGEELANAILNAIDNAPTVEPNEVYMTGEDYNLYMEGYKAGKKDFEPKQGEWEK